MSIFTPPRSNVRPFGKPENTFVFGVFTVQTPAPSTSPFRTISSVSLLNTFCSLPGGTMSATFAIPERSTAVLRIKESFCETFPSVADSIPCAIDPLFTKRSKYSL